MSIKQNFAKDFSNLKAVVAYVEDMQAHGSVSQRRPDLGKMIKCPYCHARRRSNGPRCCNSTFATTKRAWDAEQGFHQVECAERANPNLIGKALRRHMREEQKKISRKTKRGV
jgi:hypothetical protein